MQGGPDLVRTKAKPCVPRRDAILDRAVLYGRPPRNSDKMGPSERDNSPELGPGRCVAMAFAPLPQAR